MKQPKNRPYLVCVTGLKNSGKTTVCTALIADLTTRGYAVAALKSSHVARLSLDHRAGDSYALAESGARFVLVQGPDQGLILERGGRSFRQMLERVPDCVDFIVSEGGEPQVAGSVIVCLSNTTEWEETLQVRGVPAEKILAVAGSFVQAVERVKTFRGIPTVDTTQEEDRKALVERILQAARRR